MPTAYSPLDAFSTPLDPLMSDEGDAASLVSYVRPLADRTRYLARRLGGDETRITVPAGAATVALGAQPADERLRVYVITSIYYSGDPVPVVTPPTSTTRADGDRFLLRVYGDKPLASGPAMDGPELMRSGTYEFSYEAGDWICVGFAPFTPTRTAARAQWQSLTPVAPGTAATYKAIRRTGIAARLQAGDAIRADASACFRRYPGNFGGAGQTKLVLRILSIDGGETIEQELTLETGEQAPDADQYDRQLSGAISHTLTSTPPASTTFAVELGMAVDGSGTNVLRAFRNNFLLVETWTQGAR